MPFDPISVFVGIGIGGVAVWAATRPRAGRQRIASAGEEYLSCSVCGVDFDAVADAREHATTEHAAIGPQTWRDIINGVD